MEKSQVSDNIAGNMIAGKSISRSRSQNLCVVNLRINLLSSFHSKELSLCHKFSFCKTYIFSTFDVNL